jgi:hypothetical protein
MNWYEAKKACAKIGDGWRLPTKDELIYIFQNRSKIGGFSKGGYWSSTDYKYENDNDNAAWYLSFDSGLQLKSLRSNPALVRAVKSL